MKHIFDDSDKNKYEAYSKEEVLEVIQETISSGELPEEINGLVLTFKNPVDNQAYKIAFCTQAKYNELVAAGQIEENCYYFITDDSTYDDLENAINTLQAGVNQHTSEIEDIKEDITDINDDITALDGRVTTLESQGLDGRVTTLEGKVTTLESKHIYKHDMCWQYDGVDQSKFIWFTIYTNSPDELTPITLKNYIPTPTQTGSIYIAAAGRYKINDSYHAAYSIEYSGSGTYWVNGEGGTISIGRDDTLQTNFKDFVTTLL